jgi:putative endonuclease
MPFFVYILQSEKHSRFYTGMSSDPEKRLFFHNQGLNRSTRLGIPWKKVWQSQAFSNKTAAFQLERRIKKRGAGRFLEELSA